MKKATTLITILCLAAALFGYNCCKSSNKTDESANDNEPLNMEEGVKLLFGDEINDGKIFISEPIHPIVSDSISLAISYDTEYDNINLNISDKNCELGDFGKYVYDFMEKEMPYEILHMSSMNVSLTFDDGNTKSFDGYMSALFNIDEVEMYDFDIKDIDLSEDNAELSQELTTSNIKAITIGPNTIEFEHSRTAPTIAKMREMKIETTEQ